MGKTIFVLLDACRFDTATEYGGYIEQMVDMGLGAKYRLRGELPSMSRPIYETLMTGLPTHIHGIVGNKEVRPSRYENLFSLCRKNGLTTAAAAYSWYSELYAACPFNSKTHRHQLNTSHSIQHGIYYYEDQYPDSHLFSDGEFLRTAYNPDFLLMHSMNIDYTGHLYGPDSQQYRQAVQTATELLSNYLPGWLEQGYSVVVSADHGMDASGIHGGTTTAQREIPLYLFGTPFTPGRYDRTAITQLNVTPLICKLLRIPVPEGMLSKLEIV